MRGNFREVRRSQASIRTSQKPCSGGNAGRKGVAEHFGILTWIVRLCKPTLSYNVFKLQGRNKTALVGDITICNIDIVIRYTLADSKDDVYFHYSYVGDASFAEEDQPNEFT